MIAGEWNTRFRWVPIVVVACVIGATCLTVFIIFPCLSMAMPAVVFIVAESTFNQSTTVNEMPHCWIISRVTDMLKANGSQMIVIIPPATKYQLMTEILVGRLFVTID